MQFLWERNPFTDEPTLRNIETGVVANEGVNVDQAKRIGNAVLELMEDQNALSFTFKKSNKAVTLGIKNTVKTGDDDVHEDPQLPFQRLLTVSDHSLDNPVEVFKYELCSYPASLFDKSGQLRESQKSVLSHAIWDMGCCGVETLPTDPIKYIQDGGSLMHRIPWKSSLTFH